MDLSNENRLLLYCAQTKIPEATLDQIRDLVSARLNWEEILKSALWHGIAPLLYHNLKDIHDVPQKVIDRLKKTYHGNIARNMYLYAELRRILKSLHEKGVGVIVLKGAALAEMVYGDIALRSFSDLDLLVKKEDLSCAEEIMSDLKYSAHVGNKSQEWYRQNHFHLSPFIHSNKSTVVEIHWHVINRPLYINIDDWWKRARRAKIAGSDVLTPSPEDMLLHLCLHLFNHSYDKSLLRGICDISEALRYYKDELNWTHFQNEVNEYGISKLVYSVLYLVKELYRNDSDFLNWLKPDEFTIDLKLVALMGKKIFTGGETSSGVPGPLVQLLAADRFWDKVKISFARIFPAREVMSRRHSIPLSSKKLYFCYLARPYKLFLKYGRFISDISR